MGSDLEKSTKRLIRRYKRMWRPDKGMKINYWMFAKQQIRRTAKKELLQNQQHIKYKDLSIEELANERDRISFTFRKI